jgi:hypothetical protein
VARVLRLRGVQEVIGLPAYIDSEAWAGFAEMRRKIRAPLTDRASMLILRDLQKIKDAGHCPNAALDQSTMNGWRGVWPAKEKQIEVTQSSTSRLEAEKRARDDEQARLDAYIARTTRPALKRVG